MLKLYNSFSKKKEVFKSLKDKIVKMYNCGPTVYDKVHLGNLRTFLFADILRRYLEYKGYKVKQIMNITDVGHLTEDELERGIDKIEAKARKEKKSPYEITRYYEKLFFEDLKELNIKKAFKYPRATDHIKEMIEIIKKLLKKGLAYEVKGSVYFEVTKFKDYGKLSGNTLRKLKIGARVEPHPDKKNPWDFALWIEDPNHLLYWKSPWGKHGHPGWHIECSAMGMKYLGKTIDIHTGGEDNIFPHHEAEIAQSEGATGKKFVNYWLHTKHLLVNNKKMAKRFRNFYTLKDLLKKGYSPQAIRYLLISASYRAQLNFTFKGLKGAEKTLNKLKEFILKFKNSECICVSKKKKAKEKIDNLIKKVKKNFEKSMDDDLNTPKALAHIFDFIREINKIKEIGKGEEKKIYKTILDFDKVFGLNLDKIKMEIKIPLEIKRLIEEREKARKLGDWKKADEIRGKLKEKNIEIQDTPFGSKIQIKSA